MAPRDSVRTRPSLRGQSPCGPRWRVSVGPSLRGASGVHELRSRACVRRTLPSPESTPAAPFSRHPRPLSRGAPCPWSRRARHAFLLPASLCLSSPDLRARPQAGRDSAGGFQRHSRRPEARGDPPRGWAAFRRPQALLSAPRFLPRKRRSGRAPSHRAAERPFPLGAASAARGAGSVSAQPGRTGCQGAASSRRQARG